MRRSSLKPYKLLIPTLLMGIKSSAPGNIFFFGEHAAVYGRPAICAAVGRRTEVKLRPSNTGSVVLNSEAFGRAEAGIADGKIISSDNPQLENVAAFARECAARMKLQQGFELSIKSEVPVNSGMSSSTAVFCAILGAVSAFAGRSVDKSDYFRYVYPFQAKAHGGKASGSEIISSTFGGFNYVRKKKDSTPPELEVQHLGERRFSIVVGNTRVESPTHLTVGYHVPSLIRRDADLVYKIFDKIGAISDSAVDAVKKNDIVQIGKLMNENQRLLSGLGLSHPKLDDCIKEALDAGALGAKLSGSGWGGIMFALCKDGDAGAVKKAIERTGAEAIETEVGVEGVFAKKSLI